MASRQVAMNSSTRTERLTDPLMYHEKGGIWNGVSMPACTSMAPGPMLVPVLISVPMLVLTKSPMKHPTFLRPVFFRESGVYTLTLE